MLEQLAINLELQLFKIKIYNLSTHLKLSTTKNFVQPAVQVAANLELACGSTKKKAQILGK